MGLSLYWALKCNTEECARHVIDETAKFSEQLKKKHPDAYHQVIAPHHIITCTGDEGVCIEFKFEPWKQALKQSRILKRAKFKVMGFGDPVFEGAGVFGHTYPPKMMKLIEGHYGLPIQAMDSGPSLGEGGLQTGDWAKTQYSGMEHHILGCKILDNARKHADKMLVGDDGDYCGEGDKRDIGALIDSFEEYTEINRKISGQLKNAGWKDNQILGKGKEDTERLKGGR